MNRSFLRKPFRYTHKNIVYYLIGINVFIFILSYVMFRGSGNQLLGLSVNGISRGRIWQFVTYMFVHSDTGFTHVLFNMLVLFFIGPSLEKRIGSKEFLLFYMVCGVLTGAGTYVIYKLTNANPYISLVGASGAINAVLFGFAMYYPNQKILIWGIIPVKALYMVIGYAVLSIVFQVTGSQQGVAHLTHLGGFLFAFLYFLIRLGINPIDIFRGGGKNRMN